MLTVQNLSKSYWSPRGEFIALNSVSFELGEKQSLGIVGESGAGKSTLARCILGVEPPTGGQVRFQGKEVSFMAPYELRKFWQRAQMIWQDPYLAISPHRTVWQIIAEPLINYTGMKKRQIRQRVDQLLALVSLDPALGLNYSHQLSGGQCQRVCIARALALEPGLLICDEPVSALDLPMQLKIMDLIEELKRHLGIATILITHDIGLAHRYCSTVAIMHQGRIIETGPSDRILTQSTHPYTNRLITAIPRLPWSDDNQP
jgi:ABC-type glutathione transport system ATPase component